MVPGCGFVKVHAAHAGSAQQSAWHQVASTVWLVAVAASFPPTLVVSVLFLIACELQLPLAVGGSTYLSVTLHAPPSSES